MTAMGRARRLPLGVEVALAFAAGIAAFAVVAVTIAAADSDLVVAVLSVVYVAVVAAMFRVWGVAYAVPAAVAGLLAYDWFYIPPKHPEAFPDSANLADLLGYVAVGVLLGQLAAHAARRADVSELARSELADEQAALRRVATLVARGVPPGEVFAAVAHEVGVVVGVDGARVVRYVSDHEIVQLEGWTTAGHAPLPMGLQEVDETSLSGRVLRTGSVVRADDYEAAVGTPPESVRGLGVRSAVAAPIVVDGGLWGAMMAWSVFRPLPEDADTRLVAFIELVATAISNSASREELARLADEQAALRRVATLVAHGMPPPEVFAAVAQEVGSLLLVDSTYLARYGPGETVVGVGSWSTDGTHMPVGTRAALEGNSVTAMVHRTGRPARLESYEGAEGPIADLLQEHGLRSSVGAPIVVDGRLWGVMIASAKESRPLAADSESRISAFADLVATAISNTEARVEVGRLADEQAALRRVATLVAHESSRAAVFAKVAEEVGLLLGVDSAWMHCYEADGGARVVASWGALASAFPVGSHLDLAGDTVAGRVRRTGRPARIEDYPSTARGPAADITSELGVRSAVGSPIVVDGRLWGALTAATLRPEHMPPDAALRIGEFTELVATAVSNIQARGDLAASRARIVAAADDERRRVVRDLHDGAQQRLVHTVVTLKLAQRALDNGEPGAPALVAEALQHAKEANGELRELAHGILPAVLTRGGLRAGVGALASRMSVPVDIGVSVGRLPAAVEATAYFIVAEALTNVTKHAQAHRAEVTALVTDSTLHVRVRDDGVGGARADGSGLQGVRDRVAVLRGRLRMDSPAGGGTLIAAAIPVPQEFGGSAAEEEQAVLPGRSP